MNLSLTQLAELPSRVPAYFRWPITHRRTGIALEHPDVCPMLPGDHWIELPVVMWAPLERRLLDNLPGIRVTPVALDLPGLVSPRRAAILRAPVELKKADAISDAERLAFLTRPGDVLVAGEDVGTIAGDLTRPKRKDGEADAQDDHRGQPAQANLARRAPCALCALARAR